MADPRRYSPFALIGVLVIVLLGFAAFFVSFLVAPLAILILFYLALATSERAKAAGDGDSSTTERVPGRDGASKLGR